MKNEKSQDKGKHTSMVLSSQAKALSEGVNELYNDDDEEEEQEASSSHSAQSEQGSITSKDPYNNELYQDGQDLFA